MIKVLGGILPGGESYALKSGVIPVLAMRVTVIGQVLVGGRLISNEFGSIHN